MLAGGVDAVMVETCQDLLQAKSAIIGAQRAMSAANQVVPIICHVTVETTGTMLLGSEIGAALTALEPLGIDLIGLNCATGPAEMSEHLRYLAAHQPDPALGDAERWSYVHRLRRRCLPVEPGRTVRSASPIRARVWRFTRRRLLRNHPGAHPTGAGRSGRPHPRSAGAGHRACCRLALSTGSVCPRRGVLMIGERTNANGSKAFREAMLEGRLR